MLEESIKKYRNNLLTAVEILENLIHLAKEIRKSDERAADLGLSEHETAFYDALAMNESAKEVMGDEKLRDLARVLVVKVKKNTSIDWTIKESVKANLRAIVKRLLREYGYPPDQQKIATENVLEQAKLIADELIAL